MSQAQSNEDLVAPSFWDAWKQPMVTSVSGYMAHNPGANMLPTADKSSRNESTEMMAEYRMPSGSAIAKAYHRAPERISDDFILQEKNSKFSRSIRIKGPDKLEQAEYAMRHLKPYDNAFVRPGEALTRSEYSKPIDDADGLPRNRFARPELDYNRIFANEQTWANPSRIEKRRELPTEGIAPAYLRAGAQRKYNELNDQRSVYVFQPKGNSDVREMTSDYGKGPDYLSGSGRVPTGDLLPSAAHYRKPLLRYVQPSRVDQPSSVLRKPHLERDHNQLIFDEQTGAKERLDKEIDQATKWDSVFWTANLQPHRLT